MSLKLGLRNKIRRSRAGGFTGLLDQSFASGATAAYSLRQLKSSATKAVRVREDSGNTETDIGFSGGTLDTTALLNHVGSNNGFVTKWYDQSGNGNDASQSTASNQPQIIDSGSVIRENGVPALEFDGTKKLKADYGGKFQPLSFFIVHSPDSSSVMDVMDGKSGSDRILFDYSGGNFRMFAGSSFDTGKVGVASQNLNFLLYNGSSGKFGLDGGSLVIGDVGTNKLDKQFIAATSSGTATYDGTMQELIIYDLDQSSNRTEIETNINSFYSIF